VFIDVNFNRGAARALGPLLLTLGTGGKPRALTLILWTAASDRATEINHRRRQSILFPSQRLFLFN